MGIAGQRDPARFSWPRAVAHFALFCVMLVGLSLAIDGEPGGIAGGVIAGAWAVACAHRVHLRHRAELEGTPPPSRLTRLQVAVALLSVVGFVAVVAISARERDREQVVARALGADDAVSEADELRITRFFETLETFSSQHQDTVTTLDDADSRVREHRAAVERLTAAVDRLRAQAGGIADPDVKAKLTNYAGRVRNLAGALDYWVEVEECCLDDERAFDMARVEIENTTASVQRADEELRDRLAAEMTPEERKRLTDG